MINSFKNQYSFLSNFYPVNNGVRFEGYIYPTVEHAFQAAKTLSEEKRAQIRYAESASAAKRLGRKVKLRPNWNEIKIDVMTVLVRQKFNNDEILGNYLIATGEQELIEGNWWGDTFWGVCQGEGENHLGKILMKIRAELKKER